jgi:DNA (cytosine-5)-methyltransferase 1
MKQLEYGSLCTGLAAETVAWHPLGWQPRWFAEVDPFCCEFLAHHYPAVPNRGDITKLQDLPKVDLIVGGTPCQSYSIGGLREGLSDPRGQLTLHYLRIVATVQPRWFVWENVPHLLSVHGGRDFGAILGEVENCGYGWAFRILDLRAFGTPQKRRRLWMVGHRGDMRPAAAVLFGREDMEEAARSHGTHRCADSQRDQAVGDWGFVITGDQTPKIDSRWIPTLRAQQGGEGVVLWTLHGPRRLTPREWERAQGFPDDYSLVPFRGRPASDSQRRRAIGNAFPPPVLRWLGERIQAWEQGRSG